MVADGAVCGLAAAEGRGREVAAERVEVPKDDIGEVGQAFEKLGDGCVTEFGGGGRVVEEGDFAEVAGAGGNRLDGEGEPLHLSLELPALLGEIGVEVLRGRLFVRGLPIDEMEVVGFGKVAQFCSKKNGVA